MFGIDFLALITAAGYLGIAFSITVESGLFFGFLLPGDSLLFTVGLLASQGIFNIYILIPLLIVCAIVGDSAGYIIGKKFGPQLFTKKESLLFKPAYLHMAHQFFLKYGPQAIFIARFTPVVRSVIPIIAGIAHMPQRSFTIYNILGAFVWAGGITLLGYFLGLQFPNTKEYLVPIIAGIILISLIPVGIEYLQHKRREKKLETTERGSENIQ